MIASERSHQSRVTQPVIPNAAFSVILLLLVVAMAAQVYVNFAPGAMSPDSLSILSQARSGIFEDGHPPLMTGIWRLVDQLVPGPVGMLLLHLAMFYGGLFLIFNATVPDHRYLAVIVCLAVGLYPPLLGILGTIWIDVMMAGLYLLAVGSWLSLGGARLRSGAMLLALSLIALAIASRHNAAAAACPLLALFFLREPAGAAGWVKSTARAIAWGAAATVLLFLGTKWISAQFVDQPRHLWQAAAVYDIAGASYHEGRDLFRPGVLTNPSLAEIRRLYSPRSNFSLMSGEQQHPEAATPASKGEALHLNVADPRLGELLGRNWLDVVMQHPQAYLRHRADFFRSMVKREPWGLWTPYFDMIYPNELGIEQRLAAHPTPLFRHVHRLSTTSRLFEPLPHLIVSAVLFAPVLLLGLALRDRLLLTSAALYASGLCHMGGLFFFAVTPDFRYSHWLLTATAVASGLLALALSRLTGAAFARSWQGARGKHARVLGR